MARISTWARNMQLKQKQSFLISVAWLVLDASNLVVRCCAFSVPRFSLHAKAFFPPCCSSGGSNTCNKLANQPHFVSLKLSPRVLSARWLYMYVCEWVLVSVCFCLYMISIFACFGICLVFTCHTPCGAICISMHFKLCIAGERGKNLKKGKRNPNGGEQK